MKRIFAILLSLIFIVGCFVGCTPETTSEDAEPVVEENPVVEEVPVVDDEMTLSVGLITLHDENSSYDRNFIIAMTDACEAAGVNLIIKTNIPEGEECYEAAMDLVDRGCGIVFADSFGHESYMIAAAQECPEVEFCHATGYQALIVGMENFHNAFASIYEGRYLAGIAAGLKLNEMIANEDITPEEAMIGYVGALDYAEVISGYTSFFLGARSICPTATMKVIYTGSWYDETLEREAANALMDRGCVLISQHADSMGAPGACEERNVPNVSYNMSMLDACPNTYIVSSKINWQPYFDYIIDCVLTGTPIATDWTGSIETGSVELTEWNTNVIAEGTIETVEAVKAELLAGDLHVFDTSTFTVDGKPLPDDNYVFDGYFHESELASAPAFAYYIDGIEVLAK